MFSPMVVMTVAAKKMALATSQVVDDVVTFRTATIPLSYALMAANISLSRSSESTHGFFSEIMPKT